MVFKEPDVEDIPCSRLPVASSQAVDIIRSRFSALYELDSLPIFSALDTPRPVDGALADLIFVDAGPPPTSLETLLHALPYHGPGWYHRPAVEYLMHTRKVTWSDLKLGVQASGHLPGDVLRGVFDVMDKAWTDVLVDYVDPERKNPSKDSINCWVGFCAFSKASPTFGRI
jgi:hypothetical protein